VAVYLTPDLAAVCGPPVLFVVRIDKRS